MRNKDLWRTIEENTNTQFEVYLNPKRKINWQNWLIEIKKTILQQTQNQLTDRDLLHYIMQRKLNTI